MEINQISWLKMPAEKIIFGIIGFTLILPVFVLPPYFQPSDWTRAMLFKIAISLLAAFLLFKFLYQRDFSFSVPKRNFWAYLPLLMLSAYIFLSIISVFFSQDVFFSVFDSPARAGGMLNLFFFLIFACLLTFLIKDGVWRRLLKIHFAAGGLASLLAIIQYFGIFNGIFLGFETGSTPSFLGNSTFLAIYMLFLLFAAFDCFISQPERKKKLFFAGLCLIFLFTILVTGSRATYLGVILASVFYFLLYPSRLVRPDNDLFKWLTQKRFRIFKIAFAGFLAFILLGLLYVNLASNVPFLIEKNARLSYLFHNRLSLKVAFQDLTGARLPAWKITWESIKERPWFGWGPENSYIGFEKHFSPRDSQQLQRLWWDRPHNIFLEIWASSGIFALITYIAFWTALFLQLGQAKKRRQDIRRFNTMHSLQAMFIGYLFVLFFNFNSWTTHLTAFFFIGYAFYLLNEDRGQVLIAPPVRETPLKKPLTVALSIALLIFFWFWNIKPLYLGEKIVFAQNESKAKHCRKAIAKAESTDWAKSRIIVSYAALRYADVMQRCTYITPEKEAEHARNTVTVLRAASKVQPDFSRVWTYLGAFSNIVAAREEDAQAKHNVLQESREYLKKALELSPGRQEIFIEIEKNYMLAEDYQSMKKYAAECIQIDTGQGHCYWYLGIAEIFLGEQEQGKKHIQESQDKNYNDPPYIQLGVAYISQKNYRDAAKTYEKLVAIYPQNVSYRARLAILYKETGEFAKAAEQAKIVFSLDRSNPGLLEFLRVLIGVKPNDISIRYALVDIYKSLGDTENYKKEIQGIISVYLSLVRQNPKEIRYHLELANSYREIGEFEKAIDYSYQAFKLGPQYAKNVNDFLREIPDFPEYSEKRLLTLEETEEYAKYLKRISKEFIEAESAQLRIVQENPNDAPARIQMAELYIESGQYQKAINYAMLAFAKDASRARQVYELLRNIPSRGDHNELLISSITKMEKAINN